MRTLLAFLALCAVAAGQARVEGRVVATNGESIGKATVRLAGGGPPAISYVEVSNSDGRFLFENIPPGRYSVSAQKLSYAPPPAGTLPAFVLAAGEAKRDVEIKLSPLGVVSGIVTDFDGDPVAAQVQLMRRGYTPGRVRLMVSSASSADDRGRFRLPSVAPGRYYVMATDPAMRTVGANASEIRGPSARDVNLTTYHPNSSEVAGAIAIDVKSGAEVSNVNVRMRRGRTYMVRGVTVDESGAPAPQVSVTLYQASDEGPSANMSTNSRPGTGAFEFRGLAAGSYTLLVRATPRNTDAGATVTVSNGQAVAVPRQVAPAPQAVTNLSGRVDFTISSGDLENLSIRLTQGAEITGRVRLDGDGDLAAFLVSAPRVPVTSPDGKQTVVPRNPPTVSLQSDEGNAVRMGNAVAADGTFRIPNITPSKYMVSVGPLAPGAYVKSIRWGSQDLTNTLLDLSSGNGGAMEIVVSPRGAALNGVARNSRGDLMPSGMVTMWPAARVVTDQQGGVRNLRSTPQGTFQFTGLTPGDYYVVLWEEVSADLSRIPDFLDLVRSGATKVSLSEGETANVDLKPVSRDTVEKAVDQFR